MFRDIIKDEDLALAAEKVAKADGAAAETRRQIAEDIRARSTAPAK